MRDKIILSPANMGVLTAGTCWVHSRKNTYEVGQIVMCYSVLDKEFRKGLRAKIVREVTNYAPGVYIGTFIKLERTDEPLTEIEESKDATGLSLWEKAILIFALFIGLSMIVWYTHNETERRVLEEQEIYVMDDGIYIQYKGEIYKHEIK